MATLSPIYDSRNEGYPLFHTGVLAFVITTCLPLSLGLSKLPATAAFAIFAVGFLSLFMLVRNQQVGLDLLNHLHIDAKRKSPAIVKEARKNRSESHTVLIPLEGITQDPFPHLQNMIEKIISTHDDQMNHDTKERLVQVLKRLQNLSQEIGNHKEMS